MSTKTPALPVEQIQPGGTREKSDSWISDRQGAVYQPAPAFSWSRQGAGTAILMVAIMAVLSSFALPPEDAFVMTPFGPLWGAYNMTEPVPAPQPYVIPGEYEPWVRYYADERGIPHWMAARLFSQESVGDPLSGRWNPRAVSWMGAVGLAQLMPENTDYTTVRGRDFARRYNDGQQIDPRDPETAIRVGLRFLADLYSRTGSWTLALLSYNGGIGHYINPRRYGPYQSESIDYARAILGDAKGGR